jgi:Putative prokaryotic signal transducing protein
MDFKKPVIVYTAATNLDAHLIVDLLDANGVPARAVEDQSGVSLWMFGTISQFHKPNIWVDESTAVRAAALIQGFEEKRRERNAPHQGSGEVDAVCEDCGKTTSFPKSLDGAIQECSHCHAYVDVGDLPWDDDFGVPDD